MAAAIARLASVDFASDSLSFASPSSTRSPSVTALARVRSSRSVWAISSSSRSRALGAAAALSVDGTSVILSGVDGTSVILSGVNTGAVTVVAAAADFTLRMLLSSDDICAIFSCSTATFSRENAPTLFKKCSAAEAAVSFLKTCTSCCVPSMVTLKEKAVLERCSSRYANCMMASSHWRRSPLNDTAMCAWCTMQNFPASCAICASIAGSANSVAPIGGSSTTFTASEAAAAAKIWSTNIG